MQSIVVKLLLFVYLTSTYLSATHIHHKDLESSSKCKVHILVKNLNSADALDSSFDLLMCEGCFEPILFYNNFFIQPLIKGFNAQAPPYFS
jgi:hypothetical protein